jgi:hypothetical protein
LGSEEVPSKPGPRAGEVCEGPRDTCVAVQLRVTCQLRLKERVGLGQRQERREGLVGARATAGAGAEVVEGAEAGAGARSGTGAGSGQRLGLWQRQKAWPRG